MIELLHQKHKVLLKKKAVLEMEEDIIRTLDFNLRKVSQIQFLERYLRLFGLDRIDDKRSMQIAALSGQYCKFMQREACFLQFKPSQIAAASLLFSINLSCSMIVKSILGLMQISKE